MIPRSLALSAAAVLMVIGANQAVFQWATLLRADAGRDLDRARVEQSILAELRHQLSNLSHEIDGAALPGSVVTVTRDTVGSRRAAISGGLNQLDVSRAPGRHPEARRLADELSGLFLDWDSFTAEALASPSTAAAHVQRARETSHRLAEADIPRMMTVGDTAIAAAQTNLQTLDQRIARTNWSTLALSLIVVLAVGVILARRMKTDVRVSTAFPVAPPAEPIPHPVVPATTPPDPSPLPLRDVAPAAAPAAIAATLPGAASWRDPHTMDAVGRLAGGVAHEFNNLLTVISGHSERLIDSVHSPEARLSLQEVQRATERAAALTSQLLAFSRRQVLAPRVIVLNDVIADLQSLLHRTLGERIRLELELERELWPVRADSSQLAHVVMNLTANARDAMPNGGTVRIRTANWPRGDVRAKDVPLPPTAFVALSVIDSGLGMDEETKAHIFEPFFTTKSVGQGTGLGLATAYGIVRQSGGDVLVESAPGKGTIVTVVLPRVDERVSVTHEEADRRGRSASLPGIRS